MRDAVISLTEILGRLGIRWALIGGVAANLYRRKTRMTGDVDLLLAADAADQQVTLESALRQAGWEVRRATPDGDILRMRHPAHGWADLQIALTEYQVGAIGRALPARLSESLEVPAVSPEDLIVHKLIAARGKDIGDIEALLEAGLALDHAYIEYWAEIWGVTELWRAIRSKPTHSP